MIAPPVRGGACGSLCPGGAIVDTWAVEHPHIFAVEAARGPIVFKAALDESMLCPSPVLSPTVFAAQLGLTLRSTIGRPTQTSSRRGTQNSQFHIFALLLIHLALSLAIVPRRLFMSQSAQFLVHGLRQLHSPRWHIAISGQFYVRLPQRCKRVRVLPDETSSLNPRRHTLVIQTYRSQGVLRLFACFVFCSTEFAVKIARSADSLFSFCSSSLTCAAC